MAEQGVGHLMLEAYVARAATIDTFVQFRIICLAPIESRQSAKGNSRTGHG